MPHVELAPAEQAATAFRSRGSRGFRSLRFVSTLAAVAMLSGCSAFMDPHARGIDLLDQRDFTGAVGAFSQAIDECLENVNTEEDLGPAIVEDANCAYLIEAHTNRGIANEARGEFEEAIADYTRALDSLDAAVDAGGGPENPDAMRAEIYNNRGVADIGKRLKDEAIEDLTKAIEIDEDYAEAYSNRCRTYVDREEYELAIEDCEAALELDDSLAEAYGNLGLAHESLGDDKNAIINYGEAIRISNDPQAYFNRAMLRYTLGCFDLAYTDFEEVVERADESEYLWFMAKSQRDFLEGRPENEESCLGIDGADADELLDDESADEDGTEGDGSGVEDVDDDTAEDAAADDSGEGDDAAEDEDPAAGDDAPEDGGGDEDAAGDSTSDA